MYSAGHDGWIPTADSALRIGADPVLFTHAPQRYPRFPHKSDYESSRYVGEPAKITRVAITCWRVKFGDMANAFTWEGQLHELTRYIMPFGSV